MLLDVLTLPDREPAEDREWVPVVIDLLRATTTIVTALSHGAAGVFPLETVEQARAAVEEGGLLAGERGGLPPEGFDLGNSPLEMIRYGVEDRRIWFTTSNGTRALHHASRFGRPYVVAMLNLEATATHLLELGQPVLLVCSGNSGEPSREDTFLAGAVCQRLQKKTRCRLSGRAQAALELFEEGQADVEQFLLQCPHGQKLIALGLEDDIRYAARTDICPLIVQQKTNGWL